MQPIVDSCGCHTSRLSDSRDRGMVSSLPIPYCANSLLYEDFMHGLPKVGGYHSCLVVTCRKNITGEQTVAILVEQWFEHYGAPEEVHSDEDVRIQSDTGLSQNCPACAYFRWERSRVSWCHCNALLNRGVDHQITNGKNNVFFTVNTYSR